MEEKILTFGKDVFEGDICTYDSNGRYIIKVEKKDYCNQYIGPRGEFHRTGGYCSGKWVEATPEEKRWLEACIAAGKQVGRPTVPVINNSYSII